MPERQQAPREEMLQSLTQAKFDPHAIIGRHPLIDSVPIMRRESDGAVITQFDYPTCETLGLLKMDFLGLRNLTIIDDAVKNIELNHGKKIDLLALPCVPDVAPS